MIEAVPQKLDTHTLSALKFHRIIYLQCDFPPENHFTLISDRPLETRKSQVKSREIYHNYVIENKNLWGEKKTNPHQNT